MRGISDSDPRSTPSVRSTDPARTTERPGRLSGAQRSLLAARLRQGRIPVAANIAPRGPEVRELPLSFGQEELWFIDQLAPGMSVYNVPGALRLRGDLDADALGRALDALIARHEALRTRLVTVDDGRPQQVIDPPRAGTLAFDDLSGLDPAAREPALQKLVAAEVVRAFDLAAGPLFRARLVRLTAADHVLVIAIHHSVFDGWSFALFIRELTALYREQATGQAADLPPLPIQFADYALWERERLQGTALDELIGFWRDRLDGLATVQMPTDRPRPLLQTFEGDLQRRRVADRVLDGLRALSRREGTTLYVALLTAVQVLLHRYSGQDDITVGTASANRSRPELAGMIGYLVNALPIRTDTSGDPTFVELLHKVRTTTIEAYAHQDLPFAKVVEALRVDRDPSRSPLYQIVFTMTEETDEEVRAGDVTITVDSVEFLPAKVDLSFYAEVVGSHLRIGLSYAVALFDDDTARRMLEHLETLLDGIVADPDRRLSELPLLTPAEIERELVTWNATDVTYPVMCLHQQFEAQMERDPGATAAALGHERWRYAELNGYANQIARALHERGVARESIVGVSMPASLRRLATVLGIMKAGAGYVPLDPDLPANRLAYMIEDAGTAVIVADTASTATLPSSAAEIMNLDQEWHAVTAHSVDNPDYPVTPDNVAYIIYTSGSTGRPKGVVIEHASVVNYICGWIELLSVGPGDRWLQFASLNFDASVMDMFVTLCSGATAILGTRETLHSPPRLAEMMRRQRVTGACLPPAVLHLMTGQDLPDLRLLTSAGDELSTELARNWLRPGLRLFNGYGPTEATCGTTSMELDETTLPPPIGMPTPNCKAYVLDAHLNPIPLGAAGELHVGGPCLARGYLNQPELTAQRFIPDPFSDDPGARLYKTGDFVRRLRNGSILFVGRIDGQVKIRGLRVELGEIEAVLASHPAVAQVHIKTADDAAGQPQIVGYVRLVPDARATPDDLRVHLASRVPAYMVPAHLVLLDFFPLTPSGKIDSRALPVPDTAPASSCTAPRSLIETLLVDAYSTLLGNPRIGIDDSFFDVGGNSLQAMKLVTQLHAELAIDLDVTAIFLAPTPRQLAALLRDRFDLEDVELSDELDASELTAPSEENATPADRGSSLIELTSGNGEAPLFLFHAISGTASAYTSLARELGDTYKVYALEAAGLTRGSTAITSLDEMLSSYLMAIRAAQRHGPYRLAGWSMGGQLAFEVTRRLEELGERVELLVLIDAPFYGAPEHQRQPTKSIMAGLFVASTSHLLGLTSEHGAFADPSPDHDHLGWLAAQLDGGAGNLDVVRADIERRFEVYKANWQVTVGYCPTATVRAPTIIASADGSPDWSSDWTAKIDGQVEILRIRGGHYTVLDAPGAQRIAEAIHAYRRG